MSAKEAEPLFHRCARAPMFLERFAGAWGEIDIGLGGGRMGANFRKGGRTALPPLRSAANVAREVRAKWPKLKLDYAASEWARMSAEEEEPLSPRGARPLILLEIYGGHEEQLTLEYVAVEWGRMSE